MYVYVTERQKERQKYSQKKRNLETHIPLSFFHLPLLILTFQDYRGGEEDR